MNNEIKIIAPGRICLFGDHQDYLGLPVIACAINRQIQLRAIPNGLEDFVFSLPDIKSERRFSIFESFDTLEAGDFLASTIRRVKKYGCIPDKGYDISIHGNIPVNAGISSSSAIVVAWVFFLLKSFGANREISSEFISQLAYEAEVIEHNSPGGKMDQYAIGIGNIIFIETGETLSYHNVDNQLDGLILGESGVLKDTIGLLNIVKSRALESIDIIKNSVPDFQMVSATLTDYDQYSHFLSAKLKPYFYAGIQNHIITQQAFIELSKNEIDYKVIGTLMNDHHNILRDQLNVSIPKIDDMILAALDAGAYGAKIVGSGGGGCIVVLSPPNKKKDIINAIIAAGGKDAYEVLVASGAHIV